MMDKKTVMERIERSGIVPVAVIDAVEKAVPLADAMLDGGVDVIEVTFRTAAAADAFREEMRPCMGMLSRKSQPSRARRLMTLPSL